MPALAVIRSGCKSIEYLENRSISQHTPQLNRLSNCKEEDDEEMRYQAEEAWRGIGTNFGVSLTFGLSQGIGDMKDMHAFWCADCGNLVGDCDDIISKTFFGRDGKAFLMNTMYNIRIHPARNRYLMTGMYSVADVVCCQCGYVLGWKYLRAVETSQKYKEGKFIMERTAVENASQEQVWE